MSPDVCNHLEKTRQNYLEWADILMQRAADLRQKAMTLRNAFSLTSKLQHSTTTQQDPIPFWVRSDYYLVAGKSGETPVWVVAAWQQTDEQVSVELDLSTTERRLTNPLGGLMTVQIIDVIQPNGLLALPTVSKMFAEELVKLYLNSEVDQAPVGEIFAAGNA